MIPYERWRSPLWEVAPCARWRSSNSLQVLTQTAICNHYNAKHHTWYINACRKLHWSQLLDAIDRDDCSPRLASPTKHPVGNRHLATLWSLRQRKQWWENSWKVRCVILLWERLGEWDIGSSLKAPRRKNWETASRNSLPGTTLLLHFVQHTLLYLLLNLHLHSTNLHG